MVVTEHYPGAGSDIPPAVSAMPVVVPALGKSGLLNSGEKILLESSSGQVVSSVPSLASPSGISVARIDLWGPDAPEAFALHGAPGGSPGAPNSFDEGS